MAVVVPAPPVLSRDLVLFHTTDPLLSNAPLLIFYGPSATLGATSSRVQLHIFSPGGPASYSRLAVSPTSPLYSAVRNLPREEQGDETIRGLAFGIKKYFEELPQTVKTAWCSQVKAAPFAALFGDDHVAILASRMIRIDNVEEVARALEHAFPERRQTCQEVDIVLPPGAIKSLARDLPELNCDEITSEDLLIQQFGRYASLMGAFGDESFLPTSHLKRAPSKASTIGRSASFLAHQKEAVSRELHELLDTELKYVARLAELCNLIAAIVDHLEPDVPLRAFASTTQQILEANQKFSNGLQQIISLRRHQAENETTSTVEDLSESGRAQSPDQDADNVTVVGRYLYECLPSFENCYTKYLSTHSEVATTLRRLREENSPAALKLRDLSDQKVTSLLIDPVQRLPRYSLLIDSITKQLPLRHAALTPLLKARDLVTQICAGDNDSDTTATSVLHRLRHRVPSWPATATVNGRLITIVDVEELSPPFIPNTSEVHPGLLLLFTDRIVLLGKSNGPVTTTTAKSLQTELDSHLLLTHSQGVSDLEFLRCIQIDSVDCTESDQGQLLHLVCRAVNTSTASGAHYTLNLQGAYHAKASRLIEEVVKASIEHRFSQAERESSKWQLRALDSGLESSLLLSAVMEDSNLEHLHARSGRAATRILVDIDKHSHRPRASQDGARNIIALAPQKDGTCRLTVDSIDGPASQEYVSPRNTAAAISRRLAVLSHSRYSVGGDIGSDSLLVRNTLALHSIDLLTQPAQDSGQIDFAQERVKRPKSPMKMLSSILAGSLPVPSSPTKKDRPVFPTPSLTSNSSTSLTKPAGQDSRPSSKDQSTLYSLDTSYSMDDADLGEVPRLEKIMSAYLLALRARKGNIVGRSLASRGSADETMVNELYNNLLEDASMVSAAAQASVNVLFAAFEKFVHVAWRKTLGPIISLETLQDIQLRAESLFPAEFDAYFRKAMHQLAPHNRQALKGILELLADLLDGTGNDGDRGLLTAVFAEVLIVEGNSRNFIPLLDRFVNDADTYFGETLPEVMHIQANSNSSHKRTRSVNSASIASNTSSLRRKFGLGTISRSNSKTEDESKVVGVWRSLSKSARIEIGSVGSLGRASVQRTHSDEAAHRLAPNTPSSRSRSPFLETPNADESASRGNSPHQLNTIGEHPDFIPSNRPRKKRRSSLSDLQAVDGARRQSIQINRGSGLFAFPTPTTHLPIPTVQVSKQSPELYSPTKQSYRSRLPSAFRRESPEAGSAIDQSHSPARDGGLKSDESLKLSTSTSRSPYQDRLTTPNLTRFGLAERPGVENIIKKPISTLTKPELFTTTVAPNAVSGRKLRVQSPQKLRERLRHEQDALSSLEPIIHTELERTREDPFMTSGRLDSVQSVRTHRGHRRGRSEIIPSSDVLSRSSGKEDSTSEAVIDAKRRIHGIEQDVSSSLVVSEAKCKKLDELYREANAENEALYERFNSELDRILKAVQGDGVGELKRQLAASQDEAMKMRREIGRLKRENVGLRAQLRD